MYFLENYLYRESAAGVLVRDVGLSHHHKTGKHEVDSGDKG